MDMAIRVSISGGNHSASGPRPYAEAISVNECATVNDVTIRSNWRNFRNGITRHSRKQQVIGAVQDVQETGADESQGRLVPARIEPDQTFVAFEFERANRAIRAAESAAR